MTNVASMRIANLTPVRIAMTSPMQSKARGFIALALPNLTKLFFFIFDDFEHIFILIIATIF